MSDDRMINEYLESMKEEVSFDKKLDWIVKHLELEDELFDFDGVDVYLLECLCIEFEEFDEEEKDEILNLFIEFNLSCKYKDCYIDVDNEEEFKELCEEMNSSLMKYSSYGG